MAFSPDYRTYSRASAPTTAAVLDAGLRAYMLRVYNWMSSGLLLTGIAGFVSWKFAPDSIVTTAQHMDDRLLAKNRLEAAATLHGSTTPLAEAQREETAAYLRRAAPNVRPAFPFRSIPTVGAPPALAPGAVVASMFTF